MNNKIEKEIEIGGRMKEQLYQMIPSEGKPIKAWVKGVPVEEDARLQLLEYGRVPGTRRSMGERLTDIRRQLETSLKKYQKKEKYAFFNQRFDGLSPDVVAKLCEAKGVSIQLLHEHGFKVMEIGARTLEEYVPGINKSEMANYICNVLNLKVLIDDSLIMALALSISGSKLLNSSHEPKEKEAYQKGSYKSGYGLNWR